MKTRDCKRYIGSRRDTVERIDWFLSQKGYSTLDLAKILRDLAIANSLDPFGILMPLLTQDLAGVEKGLEIWWKEEDS